MTQLAFAAPKIVWGFDPGSTASTTVSYTFTTTGTWAQVTGTGSSNIRIVPPKRHRCSGCGRYSKKIEGTFYVKCGRCMAEMPARAA